MGMPVVQLITAFFGALGYAIVCNLRKELQLWSAFGGFLCWGTYLLTQHLLGGEFISCLLAAAVAEIYSEVLARLLHAPATLFTAPSVIPLVPGGSLFNTMRAAVANDWAAAWQYGILTIQCALAIAVGISLVWAVLFMRKESARMRAKT